MSRRGLGRARKLVLWVAGSVVAVIGLVAVGGYIVQRNEMNTIAAEYQKVVKAADVQSGPYLADLATKRGAALMDLSLFQSPEWGAFVSEVSRSDAAELRHLRKDFADWGDQNLWFPDLIAEHRQFVDDLMLSVTPLDRAKLSAVFAVGVMCAPGAAAENSQAELEPVFEMDGSGKILPELMSAAPALCALDG